MTNISFLVIITLAALLMVNAVAIGAGTNIALARHHDNTRVLENSHINVQTETGQSQDCETASGTSPISDSCTASSSNTISQGTPPSHPTSCTATSHPTVLTLNPIANPRFVGLPVIVTGTLVDTCTGLGVSGATITFTIPPYLDGFPIGTSATGTYLEFLPTVVSGTFTAQAHFAGQGIFRPSNSGTQTFTVPP